MLTSTSKYRYRVDPLARKRRRIKRMTWVPLKPAERLEDAEGVGGRIPGIQRCSVVGLPQGDCTQTRTVGSIYCYYHHKVHRGLLEPSSVGLDGEAVIPGATYPVYPLPDVPYRLVSTAVA